jgi:dipeptidyl aminopeptidase/acylaminoacyl peptidase
LQRYTLIALALLTLGIAALPALAELPPLIPREVLFGNPVKTQAQISPNGKVLTYLAADDKGVMNVWVRTLGQEDDKVVTADKKRGIPYYKWQQDSEHILYIQDRDGDEDWHVYQTNLKTKNTRDLTPFQGVSAQGFEVDPNYPTEMLVQLNIRDRRLHDMYRINLKNGAVEMDTGNPGDVSGFVVDNKFQVRAAQVTLPDGGTEIRVRDDVKSPWRNFQKSGPDETFGGIWGFTPDNTGVYLASSVDANASRLLEVDLATGKSKVVAEDKQYDVTWALTHPKTHKLEAVMFIRQRTEWTVIDKSLQADFDALRKVHDGDFYIFSRDLADNAWMVGYVVDNAPLSTYAYDRASKKATFLFSDRPALEKYKLAKMQPISFQARDGMTIYGYLTLPAGLEPRDLPMVLRVHGGPWVERDTWWLNEEVQWLANRGYVVLQINFRGSRGYGKAYLNAGNREWAGKMQDDLLDGKNWAVKQGYADPKQVCIMGWSFGGYATLVGLTFTPDEFVCGVDGFGISNIVTWLSTIPTYWEPIKALFKKRVGDVETEQEFLKSRSPLFKADQIKAPLLIGQGANDPRVKQAESDQIVAAMRKNKRPVEYIVFPDEGHGFARPENRLIFYAAAEPFLAKYLGGRAEPPSEKEKADAFRK